MPPFFCAEILIKIFYRMFGSKKVWIFKKKIIIHCHLHLYKSNPHKILSQKTIPVMLSPSEDGLLYNSHSKFLLFSFKTGLPDLPILNVSSLLLESFLRCSNWNLLKSGWKINLSSNFKIYQPSIKLKQWQAQSWCINEGTLISQGNVH